MKRTFSILLLLIMMLSVFAGCGNVNDLTGTMVSKDFTGYIAACVSVDNMTPYYYTTFTEAWDQANRHSDRTVVITLMADLKANDNKFGNYTVLTPSARTAPLTIDLNGFTIDKANSSAKKDGCIFSLYNACDLTIKNGTLTGGNHSGFGGCFFINSDKVYLHMENVTIKKNAAANRGGVMHIGNAGCIELTNCILEENSSGNHGGAISMSALKSTVTLNNCTVKNNTCSLNGGGIFVDGGGDSVLTLNNTTITGNTANIAGGIHWDENSGKMASVVMSGIVTISGNKCRSGTDCANMLINPYTDTNRKLAVTDLQNGSKIYVSFEGSMPYVLIDSIPEGLSAAAVFASDASTNLMTISNGAIKFQPSGDIVASVVVNNQAKLYTSFKEAWHDANLDDESTVYLTLYQDWDMYWYSVDGDKFAYGNALYPGDKDNDTWLVFDLNGHTIDRGLIQRDIKPHESGMIFYIYKNSRIILKNGTLTGGNCDDQGGAIYVCDDDAALILENMTITGNCAYNDGSAIYIDDMDYISFVGKNVIENNTVGAGGSKTTSAVNLEDGDIYFKGELFIRNNKGPVEGYENNLVLRDLVENDSYIKYTSEIHVTDCTTGYSLGYYKDYNGKRYSFRRFTKLNWTSDSIVDITGLETSSTYGDYEKFLCKMFIFDKDMADRGYEITDFRRDDGPTDYGCYAFGWDRDK